MLNKLRFFRQPCPDWLLQMPGELSLPLLRENLSQLLDNALVYPGSGVDLSPIRQTAGIVHSYIFFDCQTELSKMRPLMYADKVFKGEARLFCDILEFEIASLGLDTDVLHSCQMPSRHNLHESDEHGLGLWCIYDTYEDGLVSILFIQQEAIEGIASLFIPNRIAPRILVLQDHGFSGNCWSSFGEPYHCLISQMGFAWPEILIVGTDFYSFQDKNYYQAICHDTAVESMHGDRREICVLDTSYPEVFDRTREWRREK